MKSSQTIRTSLDRALRKLGPLALLTTSAACIPPLHAQTDIGEDEWYDPTDWFDGNNIESDDTYAPGFGAASWDRYDTYDTWNYGYNNNYWDNNDWYGSVDDPDYGTVWVDVYTYRFPAADSGGAGTSASASRNTDMNNPRTRDRSGSSGDGSRSDASGSVTLRGTIEGVRQMKLKNNYGLTDTFTVAKVKLENGRSTIVNLGEQTSFRDLDLEEGDQIKAIGGRGEIDGQSVFVARQLKADGQTLHVNNVMRSGAGDMRGQSYAQRERDRDSSGENRTQAARRSNDRAVSDNRARGGERTDQYASQSTGSRMLSGEVSSVERVRGGGADHTLVRVNLEDGTSRVVDLGPGASLRKLDVTVGDQISVRGQEKRVANRDVIVANRIRVDGRVVNPRR